MKTKEKRDVYREITDKIIEILENVKDLKYDCPWIKVGSDGEPAHNAVSKRRYTGSNQFFYPCLPSSVISA